MATNVPLIASDLEGPLSPNDNAYELMQLFPGGDHLFQVLSRYDDLLTLEGRKSYEPGGTLALIVPFLVRHGVSLNDILRLAESAGLTPGATDLISRLQANGWKVHIITTTYSPYARRLARRLGIDPNNVCATVVPIDQYRDMMTPQVLRKAARIEREVSELEPERDDQVIKQKLDEFFWGSNSEFRRLLQETTPIGGRRKMVAARTIALSYRLSLSETVVVGDSITDCRMLEAVNKAGGLAVAFNANAYALPHATLSLASTSILDLWPVLEAWAAGGRGSATEVVKAREKAGGRGDSDNFHWLDGGAPLPLEVHKRIRRLVRAKAAELG
ncbi:MAG: haloacid dehalogenase-like hydrolase [Chloroflexi bacterium]|nr:haloacid dehalogenase-like hydrolase [Chloroflexota bacterium]